MDRDEIKEFLALMTRLAVAMEEQAKHQQEFNEMARQQHIESQARSAKWEQIQIQWREENVQREMARQEASNKRDAELFEWNQQQRALQIQREDQWHKDNLELQERLTREYLKNAVIHINLDRE